MEKKYVIILSEGKEYLCCHEDGCYYDVSCPMRSFTEGKEDFEIMDSGQNRHGKTYPYHKRKLKLVPGIPDGKTEPSRTVPDITGILRGIRTTINHVTSTINNPIIGVWQNMK